MTPGQGYIPSAVRSTFSLCAATMIMQHLMPSLHSWQSLQNVTPNYMCTLACSSLSVAIDHHR